MLAAEKLQETELKETAGECSSGSSGTRRAPIGRTSSDSRATLGPCKYRREAARTRARQKAAEMDNQEMSTKAMRQVAAGKMPLISSFFDAGSNVTTEYALNLFTDTYVI